MRCGFGDAVGLRNGSAESAGGGGQDYASARKQEFEAGKCSHYDEGAYVCNTTHCQVYRTEEGLREVKGDEWMEKNFPKILSAVYETAGEVLYYDGSLVEQPLFSLPAVNVRRIRRTYLSALFLICAVWKAAPMRKNRRIKMWK